MTVNRVKVVFLQTGTEPSYIMLYKQKINPQTEINTRRAFLDTIYCFCYAIFTKVHDTALLQITAVIINKSDTRSLLIQVNTVTSFELLARLLPSCLALF